MKSRWISSLALAAIVAALVGCSAGSVVIERPKNPTVNRAVTQMWGREIRRVAKTGDWILTRSYSFPGDLIVTVTRGESISHSSIYDARTGTVIEALSPEVREVPLEHLLDRNQHAIVVRPSGLSAAQRRASVERARTTVGTRFDYGGLIGIGARDRYYCSELLYWASGMDPDERPLVVSPASLMKHGEVIYFSGKREDPRIQNAAFASERLLRARASKRAEVRVATTRGR